MASASLTSYETALCVLPPSHLTGDIERLRALYDKAHGRWPPHVNLIYPFVAPELLSEALEVLRSTLSSSLRNVDGIDLRLDTSGFFAHRRTSTVYLSHGESEGSQALLQLRRDVRDAFSGQSQSSEPGPLHLTIGQSDDSDLANRRYLLDKVALLPAIEWRVGELVVLIRDRSQALDTASSPMRIWGTVSLSEEDDIARENILQEGVLDIDSPSSALCAQPGTTFHFSHAGNGDVQGKWRALNAASLSSMQKAQVIESPVTVSSYNVLIESMDAPATERYPVLLRNLLSSSATADILILQEVADAFLSFLLQDEDVRLLYPFATHGPPDQPEISPLASLRNIVVLSRWPFRWEWLPFEKRHKGTVVVQLEGFSTPQGDQSVPLVVAGVHLTCGLSDSSIVAKRSQLQAILNHLSTHYLDSHWVVAGDFNITTSSYTIGTAVKRNSISAKAASVLSSLDGMLTECGLSDCYFAARASCSSGLSLGQPRSKLEFGALYEGEEDATFDPTENSLAARTAGQGFHSRPQRYDRIMTRGDGFQVAGFNLFGFPSPNTSGSDELLGSDHWGVRAVLKLDDSTTEDHVGDGVSIDVEKAPQTLGSSDGLKEFLREHQAFPSTDEITQRREVVELIQGLVNQRDANLSTDTRLNLSFVVVPVGSYGLGVWNSKSDLDLLVIGQISPRTFFALMIAKLRKAVDSGVVILRKVRAASGTMLELEARGVRVDLQYCTATRIVERWPQVLETPQPDDHTFDLPMQSLLKLNPLRDMRYLQRTIPDLATFRLAYRFIKMWAQSRGIYSSKLGYLGGIHITLLLSRICKLSFHQTSTITPADIIWTFFRHYAQFKWAENTVYDPTFYKKGTTPRYFRSSREPWAILTQHAPKVNVARAASLPSTRTMELEFKRVEQMLSNPQITWADLIGAGGAESGVDEFLHSYASYAKLSVQYWGKAVAKGRMLVGWLEWRCVSLLVDIHRRFPDLHVRLWPARFTGMDDNAENAEEYQGCYLIGLAKWNDGPGPATPKGSAERRSAHIALVAILNTFAQQIRDDERYFDASSNWVDVSLVQQSELRGFRLDTSNWGDPVYDEDDPYDDESDEFDLEEEEEEEEEDDDDGSQARPLPRHARTHGTGLSAVGVKLRPASDILNRLRWDANLNLDDFVVGYDDRFLGEREMPVSQWKAELTDEAFIPMHRILYFKRKSDGVKVWDRDTKTDLLFNSGASKPRHE